MCPYQFFWQVGIIFQSIPQFFQKLIKEVKARIGFKLVQH